MTRTPRRMPPAPAVALAVALAVGPVTALAGCGSSGVAGDPPAGGPTHGGLTTIDTPVGERPAFTAEDYTFTLRISCFCPGAGTPYRVTVEDGRVTRVDTAPRAPAPPDFARRTIPDIIDRALDPHVDDVTLRWPAGQAWPDTAALDPVRNGVDDEVTYTVRGVDLTG